MANQMGRPGLTDYDPDKWPLLVDCPEKPAGTTHSSRSDLSPREQLERQEELNSSTQDAEELEGPLGTPLGLTK